MTTSAVTVVFESSGLRSGRGDLTRLTRVAVETATEELGWPGAGVAVLFCSDDRIRELNAQFREMDEATDILSFPATDDPSKLDPAGAPYLGDLAIAIPYTSRHARQQGRTLNEEIQLLLVHGVLHLLGWDHANAAEKKRMWKEQERLMKVVNERLG